MGVDRGQEGKRANHRRQPDPQKVAGYRQRPEVGPKPDTGAPTARKKGQSEGGKVERRTGAGQEQQG